jgi:hypothetical protein
LQRQRRAAWRKERGCRQGRMSQVAKGMQARAHGSPTRLRAPAARRGLNDQQPLAAPVQGWRRSASAIALYNLGQHPALSALRPPPSALFSCTPSPPSSPPCASSLEFESPEISPGGLSPRLRARSAPTFGGLPSHAQACQRVRRGLSDAYCQLQRLAPPRAPSYPLPLHPLSP